MFCVRSLLPGLIHSLRHNISRERTTTSPCSKWAASSNALPAPCRGGAERVKRRAPHRHRPDASGQAVNPLFWTEAKTIREAKLDVYDLKGICSKNFCEQFGLRGNDHHNRRAESTALFTGNPPPFNSANNRSKRIWTIAAATRQEIRFARRRFPRRIEFGLVCSPGEITSKFASSRFPSFPGIIRRDIKPRCWRPKPPHHEAYFCRW